MALKDDWKSVGKDFKKLGTDLGKSVVRSVKKGVDKVDTWASDEAPITTNTEDSETKTKE
ncbi:MAG: hypothetical protein IJC86_02820 [Clostridia bacterium]|nr:hypothetical protein [Clostridia bacterium]